MSSPSAGPLLVGIGIFLVIVGVLAWSGALSWLGHLPGDIRIERENVRFCFPITSMIVISGVVTLLVHLIRRLF